MDLPTLVLASGSPRRRRLIEQLGIPLEVRPPQVDESDLDGPAQEQVAILAHRKAEKVAAGLSSGFVLAADTLGAFEGEVLGKPTGEQDAMRMLWRMADRQHDVFSGVVVLRVDDGRVAACAEEVVCTHVLFRSLGLRDIQSYLATGEWEGKAAGYAIQGHGRGLVSQVEGSYTNVVGLPLAATLRLLDKVGYPVPEIDVDTFDQLPEE